MTHRLPWIRCNPWKPWEPLMPWVSIVSKDINGLHDIHELMNVHGFHALLKFHWIPLMLKMFLQPSNIQCHLWNPLISKEPLENLQAIGTANILVLWCLTISLRCDRPNIPIQLQTCWPLAMLNSPVSHCNAQLSTAMLNSHCNAQLSNAQLSTCNASLPGELQPKHKCVSSFHISGATYLMSCSQQFFVFHFFFGVEGLNITWHVILKQKWPEK